jgi:hypothetical protein
VSLSLVLGDLVGASNTSPVAATLTIVDNDQPAVSRGPKVVEVQTFGTRGQATSLVVTFDSALDPSHAQNLAAYRLVTPGRHGQFGARGGKTIAFRSATYNPVAHSVTLVFRKKLALTGRFQLTVSGTPPAAITSPGGTPLNGNGDGHTPGNFAQIVTRSSLAGPAPPR